VRTSLILGQKDSVPRRPLVGSVPSNQDQIVHVIPSRKRRLRLPNTIHEETNIALLDQIANSGVVVESFFGLAEVLKHESVMTEVLSVPSIVVDLQTSVAATRQSRVRRQRELDGR